MDDLFKALLACALGSTLFATSAKSDELASAMALCKANPHCAPSGEYESGGLRFIIRAAGGVQYIRCETDGRCLKLYPRGSGRVVNDKVKLFAAQ